MGHDEWQSLLQPFVWVWACFICILYSLTKGPWKLVDDSTTYSQIFCFTKQKNKDERQSFSNTGTCDANRFILLRVMNMLQTLLQEIQPSYKMNCKCNINIKIITKSCIISFSPQSLVHNIPCRPWPPLW